MDLHSKNNTPGKSNEILNHDPRNKETFCLYKQHEDYGRDQTPLNLIGSSTE